MSDSNKKEELGKLDSDPLVQRYTSGVDLSEDSGGKRSDILSVSKDSLAFKESKHRRTIQSFLMGIAMLIVCVLFSTAITLAMGLFNSPPPADWHSSALIGVFLIPPTLIMIALIRALYPSSSKAEDKDHLPALNLIKEIVIAAKEAAKALK